MREEQGRRTGKEGGGGGRGLNQGVDLLGERSLGREGVAATIVVSRNGLSEAIEEIARVPGTTSG